jgi:predicted metal-dependent phosphoesterase TrpH
VICDFHAHSTFSDGTLTPTELIDEARRAGVGCLALTDHDDVAGIPEALEHGARLGVEVMPGVEISVSEGDGARQMHVLGLAIDAQAPELVSCLAEMQEARRARLGRILERLAAAGVELDRAVFDALPDGAAVGRPHVARALVAAGKCKDEDDAFARWLRRGRPAYVGSAGIGAPEAIRLIHAAGGMAALAHPPLSVGADAAGGLAAFVERLVRLGLDGLEVQHPGHQPKTRRRLRKLARQHDLVVTGGSDFHGAARPDVALGRGRGTIEVDERTRDAILERARRYR